MADAEGLLSGERRALTIGLVLLITTVAFEALAVATALPATLRELGGVSLYGWAFSAFMLASLVGITIAGQWSDVHGPARPLGTGLVLFAAGLVIVGSAPSMGVVVLGRVVQGLGAGAVPAVAYVVIGRCYPSELRPRMFAILSTAWVVPGLVGPAVSGFVSDHFSWRWVFLGLLPFIPLAFLLVVRPVRRLGPTATAAASRTPTALRLAIGAALLVSGLGRHSPVAMVPLVATGVALGLPALRKLLPPGSLRAVAGVPAAVAMRGLLTFAFFGGDSFLPLMLTSVRGISTTGAGLALTASTLSWTAGAWVQERMSRRWRIRSLSIGGLSLVAAGLVGIITVLSPSVPVPFAAAAWAVAGLGMGLCYSMPSIVVLADAPEAEVGAASASLQLSDVLGVALGSGVGGAILAFGTSAGWTRRTSILIIDVLMVGVALVGLFVARRLPGRPAAAAP